MKAHELMTTPVSICTPDTTLASAAMTMWRTDCGALPVVDDGKVVGMITDRDICMAAATQHHDIDEIPVGSIITHVVKSCTPNDELNDILHTMEHEKIRRLPVINEAGELQGIISINDLILHTEQGNRGNNAGVPDGELVRALKGISSHWLPVTASNGHTGKTSAHTRRKRSPAKGGRVVLHGTKRR